MSSSPASAARRTVARRALAVVAVTAASALPVTAASAASVAASAPASPSASGCHLGNGVQHVINIVFDNVHFSRDNPNVPSDLEQMPHLLNFLKSNGTVLSNTHTPLIAHTADDSLTIYTGLYGDRHGQPVTNSYKTYNPDGTTDPAGSFAYWTSPVYDTASTPAAGHDSAPTMVYSPTVPAGTDTTHQTPAPWVPFTRAGCDVGNFSTANMVLENTKLDIPHLFGPDSPEAQQYNADPNPYKNQETADYVGVAVHCAQGSSMCADASATKYGQTDPGATATPDLLPTEPGGYTGYQALFGHRYVAPQLASGADVVHHGYPVTDANGNLVDLDGSTITNTYSHTPGFPGFSPSASQTLAYVADMQEAGIPVTYGYISDLHERKAGTSGCTTSTSIYPGNPLGAGDSCYVENATAYDHAFQTFFERLEKDGITPDNTLFMISAEEGDQFSGANVGRAVTPSPAGCDGVTTPCSYGPGDIGEVQVNIRGLLSGTGSAGTAYDIEPQGASVYVHGQPAPDDPTLRQMQRDTASMTFEDPYIATPGQHVVNYQAGAVEQRILHMQTADRLRTPSYTMFPVPDVYFSTYGPDVSLNTRYAYNHGYYSPNIDVTWSSFVGPGVRATGVDGPSPSRGNQPQDPNSTRTVPEASTVGTWVEETDLRPTMLWLSGVQDDYQSDGRVISQILEQPPASLTSTQRLAAAYQQVNSSVGRLATLTLQADTAALGSGSPGDDSRFTSTQKALVKIADRRDTLAGQMKDLLAQAAAGRTPNPGAVRTALAHADTLLRDAERLAAG